VKGGPGEAHPRNDTKRGRQKHGAKTQRRTKLGRDRSKNGSSRINPPDKGETHRNVVLGFTQQGPRRGREKVPFRKQKERRRGMMQQEEVLGRT